jgi:hypothetical protein
MCVITSARRPKRRTTPDANGIEVIWLPLLITGSGISLLDGCDLVKCRAK